MKTPSFNWKIILIVAGSLIAGWGLKSLFSGGSHSSPTPASEGIAATKWTCSMHPQVQQPKPGKCPICAMDLIPASKTPGNHLGPRELVMTEAAKKLARITTVPVERKLVEAEIRLVGKVAFDETRTKTMAARFPLRIDRLYVDYVGIQVRKGDHLAQIYSPELLTAQRELLSAIKFGSNIEIAREKLRLWDFSDARIAQIEKLGKPSDRMDIDALIGGIVIEKHVNEGDYLEKGQPLFTIADLSTVWVKLDAYESDAPWLRYGQPIQFEAEAVPGKVFEGTIAFIAPTLDPNTRTIDIRVNAENPDQLLKPGMFVKAIVQPTLAAGGKVIAQNLKGKWISPMHPEIVRDEPGSCPVCGMALVKAEELGYSFLEEAEKPPLVVPVSAVLKTGKRSLVYVETPKAKEPTYEGREIIVGPRAGDFYLVEEGLMEGERVVTQGNFKIDSALQIIAKPSMMSPSGGGGGGGHNHGGTPGQTASQAEMPVYDVAPAFREMLEGPFKTYLAIQTALAADDLEKAKQGAADLRVSLDKVDMGLVKGEAHNAWMGALAPIRESSSVIAEAKDFEQARQGFRLLSTTLIGVAKSFQVKSGDDTVEVHCPMAFDNQGANWLQIGKKIHNPYFGAKMQNCGEIVATFGEPVTQYEVDPVFRERLGVLVHYYFRLQKAMASDDLKASKEEVAGVRENLRVADASALSGKALAAWEKQHAAMTAAADAMFEAQTLKDLRKAFEPLSDHLTESVQAFQPLGVDAIYQAHCPMAFDYRGASWLQADETVLNPYFGAEMLNCGSIKKEILTNAGEKPEHTGHEHGK